jgi:hypothetical protein
MSSADRFAFGSHLEIFLYGIMTILILCELLLKDYSINEKAKAAII